MIENSTDAGEAELRSASRWSRLGFFNGFFLSRRPIIPVGSAFDESLKERILPLDDGRVPRKSPKRNRTYRDADSPNRFPIPYFIAARSALFASNFTSINKRRRDFRSLKQVFLEFTIDMTIRYNSNWLRRTGILFSYIIFVLSTIFYFMFDKSRREKRDTAIVFPCMFIVSAKSGKTN